MSETRFNVEFIKQHPTRKAVWQVKLADGRWLTLVGVKAKIDGATTNLQIGAVELDLEEWG